MSTYERRAKDLISLLGGVNDPFWHVATLTFLHAASQPATRITPPSGLSWAELTENPDGEQVTLALKLIEERHVEHLDGMGEGLKFVDLRSTLLGEAFKRVEKLAATKGRLVHSLDHFGLLYMACAGLSAQQARGEFFTPSGVAEFLGGILGCQPADWVIDPACGTGSLILATLQQAREQLGEFADSVTLIGVELNPRTALLTRMNLVLAGASHQSHVFCGDSLAQQVCARDPHGDLREIRFHSVIANPPFDTKVKVAELRGKPLIVPELLVGRKVAVPRANRKQAA